MDQPDGTMVKPLVPTFSGWGDPGSNPDPAGAGADENKNSLPRFWTIYSRGCPVPPCEYLTLELATQAP